QRTPAVRLDSHPADPTSGQRMAAMAIAPAQPPRWRAGLLRLLWAGRHLAGRAGPGGRVSLAGGDGLSATGNRVGADRRVRVAAHSGARPSRPGRSTGLWGRA